MYLPFRLSFSCLRVISISPSAKITKPDYGESRMTAARTRPSRIEGGSADAVRGVEVDEDVVEKVRERDQ